MKKQTFSKFNNIFLIVCTFFSLLAVADEQNPNDLKDDKIRVLTLNVFAGKYEMDFDRLQRQIEAVAELKPDVIALQEVFDDRVKEYYKNAFTDFDFLESGKLKSDKPLSFPERFVGLLRKTLEMANRFFKIVPWIKGTGAILDGDTHGLAILLNTKKGKVHSDSKLVELFESQVAVGVAPKLLERVKPKGFILVEYEVGGVKLLVVNTHLSLGVHNKRRMDQLKQVVRKILAKNIEKESSCPAIFCGDTNSDAKEPEMQWLHGPAGFKDTYEVVNPTTSYSAATWHRANHLTKGHLDEINQRIDFVSTKRGDLHDFEVISSKIVLDNGPFSDHYGVLTELRVVPTCEKLLKPSRIHY